MGDVMLFGILRMPYDMAMANEISRHQYWQSGQQAAQEIERLREEVKAQKLALNHAGDCAFEMLRQDAEIERLRKFIKEHDMAEVLEDWENA